MTAVKHTKMLELSLLFSVSSRDLLWPAILVVWPQDATSADHTLLGPVA